MLYAATAAELFINMAVISVAGLLHSAVRLRTPRLHWRMKMPSYYVSN